MNEWIQFFIYLESNLRQHLTREEKKSMHLSGIASDTLQWLYSIHPIQLLLSDIDIPTVTSISLPHSAGIDDSCNKQPNLNVRRDYKLNLFQDSYKHRLKAWQFSGVEIFLFNCGKRSYRLTQWYWDTILRRWVHSSLEWIHTSSSPVQLLLVGILSDHRSKLSHTWEDAPMRQDGMRDQSGNGDRLTEVTVMDILFIQYLRRSEELLVIPSKVRHDGGRKEVNVLRRICVW